MIYDLLVSESRKNLVLQIEMCIQLGRLPKGTLKKRRIRNRTYYYLAYREGGKVVNRYIGDDPAVAGKYHKLVEERKGYEIKLRELRKDWKIYRKVGIEEESDELRQVITESAKGGDFNLSLRGFLDVFYSCGDDREKMLGLIIREPEGYKNVPHYQYAICAAVANKLADDHRIEVPEWVWKDRYYMKEMYFGNIRKGKLRMYNMLYSPAEFKHRGLFVDEDILVRV